MISLVKHLHRLVKVHSLAQRLMQNKKRQFVKIQL